jgi:hypothetical protein
MGINGKMLKVVFVLEIILKTIMLAFKKCKLGLASMCIQDSCCMQVLLCIVMVVCLFKESISKCLKLVILLVFIVSFCK